MTRDKRESSRIPFSAKVSVKHGDSEPTTLNVRDVSDTGLFILTDGLITLTVGSVIAVQMKGMPFEAPIREMEVVRLEDAGAGLKFVESYD